MATPVFTFTSSAYPTTNFKVVSLNGSEAISSLFQFEIGLSCPDTTSIDLKTLLAGAASFSLADGSNTNTYSGMLAWVQQLQQANHDNYYKVLLVPPAWPLSLNTSTSAYTELSHPDVVEAVLKNGGLTASTEFDVTGVIATYPEYDFTCQYAESDLAFVSRLMEYEGIYFYFEESAGSCKMMLADDMSYPVLPGTSSIPFTDPSSTNNYDSIVSFSQQLSQAPGKATLMGYDYQNISTQVTSDATVSVAGTALSQSYPAAWSYDHRVTDPDAMTRLASVRAQGLGCWASTYSGSGAVCTMRAGFTFTLENHPVTAFEQSYLITSVQHVGNNLDQSMATGSYTQTESSATGAYYSNSFTAIPANVQFRPQQVTPKPRISGVLSGTIFREADTDSGSQNSQPSANAAYSGGSSNAPAAQPNGFILPPPPYDSQGRYLVLMPFVDGTVTGSACVTAWIRMAQPSVGTPLAIAGIATGSQYTYDAGAEVLLAFIGGDPDLPVIVGGVYNSGFQIMLTSDAADPNPNF